MEINFSFKFLTNKKLV